MERAGCYSTIRFIILQVVPQKLFLILVKLCIDGERVVLVSGWNVLCYAVPYSLSY